MISFSSNAAKWTIFSVWVKQLIGLFSTFLLLKLLTPEDFGIAMTAMLVVYLMDSLAQVGSSKYLIRSSITDPVQVNSAWSLSIIFRATASALCLITALYMFFVNEKSDIAYALITVSILPFLSSLNNPGLIIEEINDDFKNLNLITVYSKIFSSTTTIIVALLYKSYWALIIGLVIDQIISLLFSYKLNSYRPYFTREKWSEQYNFSVKIYFLSLFGFVRAKVDNFIIISSFGVTGNGKYSTAQEMGNIISNQVVQPLSRGYYSVVAKNKDINEFLINTFFKHAAIGLFFLVPGIIGAHFLNEKIEIVIFGPDWGGIGKLITIVMMTSLIIYLNGLLSTILIVKSKFFLNYSLDLIYIAIMFSSLYFRDNLGINSIYEFAEFRLLAGVAIFFIYIINFRFILKEIKTLLDALLRITISIISMFLTIHYLLKFFNEYSYSHLILTIFSAAFIYLITFYVTFIIHKGKNEISISIYRPINTAFIKISHYAKNLNH